MKKDNKGFSLIELLVVIAIMGVMVAIFGYSISMISHKRVSNNANSIKQSIQICQAYCKSQGNTEDVANAANMQRNATTNQQKTLAKISREKGLCKLKIYGPTDSNKYPMMKILIANNYFDLDDDSKCRVADGSKGTKRLEKKTTIKVEYTDGTIVTLGKDDWVDIRLSRTTGGFIASQYSVGGDSGYRIPAKIIVTDTEKTVTLNLATYTGVVTKD